jgi:hypothetical protein
MSNPRQKSRRPKPRGSNLWLVVVIKHRGVSPVPRDVWHQEHVSLDPHDYDSMKRSVMSRKLPGPEIQNRRSCLTDLVQYTASLPAVPDLRPPVTTTKPSRWKYIFGTVFIMSLDSHTISWDRPIDTDIDACLQTEPSASTVLILISSRRPTRVPFDAGKRSS